MHAYGRTASALEGAMLTLLAVACAAAVWALLAAFAGIPAGKMFVAMAAGSFGSWFAFEQTLHAATPLLLTGLCVAIPLRAGLMVIGGEGAFVLGGLAAAWAAAQAPAALALPALLLSGAVVGAAFVGLCGLLRTWRRVHEAISSLMLTYVAIAALNQLVEGPLRDPESLDKPSTAPIAEAAHLPGIAGSTLHWGLPVGIALCVAAHLLVTRTPFGFALRVCGGNLQAARFADLPYGKILVAVCVLGGAMAGLAGSFEVGAHLHKANASLVLGYGYAGILVAVLARGNMLAVVLAALLVGALDAGSGMLQRQLSAPASSAVAMEGVLFVSLVVCGSLRGRFAPRWAQASSRG